MASNTIKEHWAQEHVGNIRLSYILRPSDGRSTIEVFTFTSDLVGEQARWTMWGHTVWPWAI